MADSNGLLLGPGGQASLVPVQNAGMPPGMQIQDPISPLPPAESAANPTIGVLPTSYPAQASLGPSILSTSTASAAVKAAPTPAATVSPSAMIPLSNSFSSGDTTSVVTATTLSGTTSTSSGTIPLSGATLSSSRIASTISSSPSSAAVSAVSITMTTSSSLPAVSSTPTESSSVPVSSPASTTKTEPSSSSVASATSATTTASSSINAISPSSHHGSIFYVGIALGVLVMLGFIISLVTWWLRMNARARRRALEESTAWPWDKDTPHDAHLEDGLGVTPTHWETINFDESKSPYLGPVPPSSTYQPYPASRAAAQNNFHALGDRSPYPTIPFPGTFHSVSELSQDIGTLQVANLMPGDVSSSGDESSRSNSALGTLTPEFGSPQAAMGGVRPRFTGLEGNGLQVPWEPLQPKHSSKDRSSSGWDPLPYPGQDSIAGNDGWTASLKNNLLHAFNAVVGGNTSAEGDNLTEVPHRARSRRSSRCNDDDSLTRRSTMSDVAWSLEEKEDGTGLVHIKALGRHEKMNGSTWVSSRSSSLRVGGNVTTPPTALVNFDDPFQSITRASSVYSTASATSNGSMIGNDPPRLPSIPPMSRSSTLSGDEHAKRRNTKFCRSAKKARKARTRPSMTAQPSSSACSMISIGSEMSHLPERLTDQEEFAKMALRERRKKVMNAGKGRGMGSTRAHSVRRL